MSAQESLGVGGNPKRGYSVRGLRRRVARLNAGTLSRERFNAIKDRYKTLREAHSGR